MHVCICSDDNTRIVRLITWSPPIRAFTHSHVLFKYAVSADWMLFLNDRIETTERESNMFWSRLAHAHAHTHTHTRACTQPVRCSEATAAAAERTSLMNTIFCSRTKTPQTKTVRVYFIKWRQWHKTHACTTGNRAASRKTCQTNISKLLTD